MQAHSCADFDALPCANVESYALADRDTNTRPDVDAFSCSDLHAHSGTDRVTDSSPDFNS